jgi:NAD(P)-dependent dehydrogenase (short-subunit alcohol dehydrogenase family)
MKLENRVAIVTGAGQGIGRAIAEKLSQEGASVVVADINTDTATKTAADIGGLAHTVDVSNEEQVAGLINTTISNYGKVDVLVNDAAIVPFTPWDDLDFAEWRRIMSVNLDGVYLTSRAVYPHMKEAGYGRIVNIASNVLVAGTPNLAHYVASKGGVFGFTRALATELGRYGITVNAISPSAFTRMTEDLRTYTDEDKETRSPKWIAPVATWLVSEESREITGRVFQAGNGQFAVAEGWHKGPEAKPVLDPRQAGKILTELARKARKNAGMNGLDLD